jgi:hypothetical protein
LRRTKKRSAEPRRKRDAKLRQRPSDVQRNKPAWRPKQRRGTEARRRLD